MTKADFDEIYTSPDPRRYYRKLRSYDYQIPAHSGTVFGQLAQSFADDVPPHVVDLCCSYGVNAAVLRHDLDFGEIVEHYCDPSVESFDRNDLLALDRTWYASNRRAEPIRVCGVDSSGAAISYASESGILDAGYAEDLEVSDPSPALAKELSEADLITVSGGIGYITERTIARALTHAQRPRMAALCLRWIDFSPIADMAAAHGLVTERLDDATFPQRQFASDEERRHVHAELDRLGIDSEGREADGYHHTDLYVLRPEQEVRTRPLDAVLEPSGAITQFGMALSDTDSVNVSTFTSGANLR